MTFKEAQEQVDLWIREYGVRYFSELTNMACLMEEPNENQNLDEEMADVLWILLCLANQTGIDLTDAFQKSIEKKTKRDKDRHINNEKLINIIKK